VERRERSSGERERKRERGRGERGEGVEGFIARPQ